MYRESPPPPQLRSAVACFWVRRGARITVRVVPDGCTDVVWRPRVGAVVAGPDTRHWFSSCDPGEPIYGVRLLPGAGGPALGVPLSALRDQRVPLDQLRCTRQPSGELDPADVPAWLLAFATELVAAGPPDRAVQQAAGRLLDPRLRVERLADELGFSERQLRRRFLASVGYGPKTLQRILRLRRLLRAPATDLAGAAAGAGYADQAHLARECLRLTGSRPRELLTAKL
jgi:AraC-like DNA-binding protein